MPLPIPTSGEGGVWLKGRVGGSRGGYRRRRFTRRRRRFGDIDHATWLPFNFAADTWAPAGEAGDLLELQTGVVNTPLTINPIQYMVDAGVPYVDAWSRQAPRLLRFDGTIDLVLPKFTDGGAYTNDYYRPYYIFFAWRRIAATPEMTSPTGNSFDPFSNTEEGPNVLTQRGPGSIISWGRRWMQPTWVNVMSAYTDWQSSNTSPSLINGSDHADWGNAQRMNLIRIPFPRLPKLGLRLPRDQTLRLEITYKRLSNATPGSTTPSLTTSASTPLYLAPMFRALVNWDR